MQEMEPVSNAIDRLPLEIIIKIFSYLPTTYWKQARLVCTKWLAASNDRKIMKHKKFIFNGATYDNDIRLIFDTLIDSSISCCNVELHHTTLKEEDIIFMEFRLSDRIFYLNFYHCSFSFEVLQKIMENCVNLQEIRFDEECQLNSCSPLPAIEEVEIVRQNLKHFGLFNCSFMSDLLFSIFINVYPNVNEIVLSQSNLSYDSAIFNNHYKNTNSRPSDRIFTFHHFQRTIASKCEKIEILNLNAEDSITGLSNDDFILLGSTANVKLNGISISGQSSITFTGLKFFLSQQPNIISVNISECARLDFKCFQYLLRQNPNISYINVTFNETDIPKTALFESIVRSQLDTIQCEILGHNVIDEKPIDTSLKNAHMKYLNFYSDTRVNCDLLLLPMLKAFENLTYLNLSLIRHVAEGPTISSYIFTHMVHLEVIILSGCRDWIVDASFNKTTGRLKNLKHLELSGCIQLTERAIRKFRYPKLKILVLSDCSKIKNFGFAHLPQSSPLLEYLDVGGTIITDETLLKICPTFKFLVSLYANKSPKIKYSTVQNLVKKCPRLRIIESNESKGFIYDYFHKTLVKKESEWIF